MKKVEIFLKNILLNILLFISNFNKKRNGKNKRISRVLFIRLNRIGDALVTTPLLHLIKNSLHCDIYLLADKKNYFAFNNNPDIDEVIVFEKGLSGIFKILKTIKLERIDTIVDLHDDVSTTVSFLIALSNASNKFGLEKENKVIYTKTVEKLDDVKYHVIERLLELGKLFDLKINNDKAKVHYSPETTSLNQAKEFINKNFEKNKFLIGINISAGSEARFWGIENYKLLIELLSNQDVNLLILSDPNELNSAKEISGKKVKIYSTESFDKFAAMIFQLNLLISPDTMAVHLAAANKVNVFGLYVHDTNAMIWSPFGSDFDFVETSSPDLKNISFEEVKRKLLPFIEKHLIGVKN